VKIAFNGGEVHADPFGLEAKLFSFQPVWAAGSNVPRVDVKSPEGEPVSKLYSFIYADSGTVKQGERMIIEYSYPGGKSGPWFDVAIGGEIYNCQCMH